MTTHRSLFCALSLGFAAMALHAQSGLVKSANQPIPGATITATEGDSKVVTTTGENGRYTLPPLAKGVWTIEASMTGFTPVHKQVTEPDSGRPLDFTLSLQESQVAAMINKYAGMLQQAGNPLESQIQGAAGADQSESFSPAPTQGGNEAFLVSGTLSQGLAAGASPDTGSVPQIGGRGGATDSSAQSQNAPGFGGGGAGGLGGILGGLGGGRMGSRGSRPPAGGAQAGSYKLPNEIHGMAFATLDNSALNAKPFSITGQDIPQPAYAQSRFGVVLGGPLVIPKIVKDPATFFFVAWFATRSRNPYTAVETVPSLLEREGNFSQSIQSGGPVTIYDPFSPTRAPFSGNIIPTSRIDPTAQKLLSYFPLPNQPGLVNNYDLQGSVPQNTDNFTVVGFRSVSKLDRVGFHFSYQRRDGNSEQPFGFLDSASGSGISSDVGWMRNFSPSMVGTLRFTFNRNDNRTVPYFANDASANLGIPGASTNPLNYGPPNLNFTNFGALSDGAPNLTRNQSQGASESLTLTHGKHSFSFGAQYTRNDLNSLTDQNGRGTFNFTGLLTSDLTSTGPVAGTGFDLADFLLGLPQSSSIRYGDTSTYFRENTWNGYTQDDWKVRTNLTLVLGARYEYFGPFSEKYGRMANLDIAPNFAAVSVVTPGDGFPAGLINPDYRNFSPRIGIAWKVPFIHRSTTIRAGYGIYYNGQAYYAFPARLEQQPPFATSNNVNTSASNVLTFAQGFTSLPAGSITNTYAVDRNYRTPYAQTWNLTIQHDLPSGFFMELGYLGTKGTHLDVQTLPNESATFNLASRTQLGNAVGFTYDSSVGNSIYNALQTRLQRRFRHGISMTALYTFSKSIDDSSTFGGVGNTVAQNWLNLAAERGLSSFDRRHSFSMNGVWTSPWGAEGSHVIPTSPAGRLLKDWQADSSITVQTGTPLTARQLGNTAMLAQTGGIGSGRAEATGQDLASSSGFFNPDAFTIAPAGEYGNAGRNTIPGPGIFAVNLGFGRSFELGDSHRRLELRMEGANVLNHVSFTNVNTVVNATNYGLPVSAAAMRTVTAILRFRF